MAHIQKRCRECGAALLIRGRACPSCGGARWRFLVRFRGPDGAEHSKTFDRKMDADAYAVSIEADRLRGVIPDPRVGRETLEQFRVGWRARADAYRYPAPSTLAKYDGISRLYIGPALGDFPLNRIKRSDVRNLIDSVAARSTAWQAQETLEHLRKLLNDAVEAELLVTNPGSRVRAPRAERDEIRVLTPDQVAELAEQVPPAWRAFILLAVYSHLRYSELAAMKLHRVDFLLRQIRVEEKVVEVGGRFVWGEPKTKKARRVVSIPELVVEALARHVEAFPPGVDGLLFHGTRGQPIHRSHFESSVWRPACTRAGVPGYKFRNLRHTGASIAIRYGGADLKTVAERLGHTTIRMAADTYVTMFEAADREVADRLNQAMRQAESDSAAGNLRAGLNE
jgi:integrase